MLNQKDPFVSMLVHAFIGAFVIALGGLLMLYFIVLVSWIISPDGETLRLVVDDAEIIFPAMSLGAIVGTILGGVAGLRKTK